MPSTHTPHIFHRLCTAIALTFTCAAPAHAQPTVAGIYTLHVEQQWIGRIHDALVTAEERGDIKYVYTENVEGVEYVQAMRKYAEQGVDLIVGEAFPLEYVARAVAKEYPDVGFLMGSALSPQEPNFAIFDNFIHEASYLTGIVAGAKTQSNLIGMVGGYPIHEVNRLMHAFMAGALSVNPDAQFLVSFIDSWYDPERAKRQALEKIDRGADILYAERYGVSDAAVERGVLTVGNVIDTAPDYPGTVLASAIWHMEPTIDRAIEALEDGTFAAEDYGQYSFMEYGGSSLVVEEEFVRFDVLQKVRKVEAAIRDKTFTVRIVNAVPQSTFEE